MNRWATGILLVYFLTFFTVKMTESGRTEDSGSLSKGGARSEEFPALLIFLVLLNIANVQIRV